eukprot:TRINITY_DN112894_c0_g1_i1.p1 TRINITY_DN112894_c0_g1~~TRINITY_DN112894_c0_g1_i1.p1  ORF type:complete len:738 (+),score=164.66 TRINITY_DN112894_c0_g1_i1:249-2462(+)
MGGGDAAARSGDASPLLGEAFLWGLISALSLNIGSVIGVTCLPSAKVCAILMSFGGGSLLFALSIELFGHTLQRSEDLDRESLVWAMEASAIVGGLLFAGLNRILNQKGADLRKPSLSKNRFTRLRAMLVRRLVRRIQKVRLFHGLCLAEVNELILGVMYKQTFKAGDVILEPNEEELNIYFVISGMVQFDIFESETDPMSASCFGTLGSEGDIGQSMTVVDSYVLGVDQVFGEMMNRRATALTSTKLLVLPDHHLVRLVEQHASVRSAMVLRILARFRRHNDLPLLAEDSLATLASNVELIVCKPGEVVMNCRLDKHSSKYCVGFGSMAVSQRGAMRQTLKPLDVLGVDKLQVPEKPVKATALETTLLLKILPEDLDLVCCSDAASVKLKITPCSEATTHVPHPNVVPEGSNEDLELGKPPSAHTSPSNMAKTIWNSSAGTCRPGSLLGSDLHVSREQREHQRRENSSKSSAGVSALQTEVIKNLADILTDAEVDERSLFPLGRKASKCSASTDSRRGDATGCTTNPGEAHSDNGLGPMNRQTSVNSSESRHSFAEAVVEDEANEDDKADADAEREEHPSSSHAAVMVWLGILIDAIPESLVIGIIINKTRASVSGVLPFVLGVFLSNLPESMSSSGMMKTHGMQVTTILMMWGTITVLTACGAVIGAALFPPGIEESVAMMTVVSSVEGLAAGAMLTMIAQTMMPEAFGQGGDVVGLSCLAGFLTALSMKMLPSD